jgi:acyl-CoA dehydrogenase
VWNAKGSCPDELYGKAAASGLLSMGFPAELGGEPGTDDLYHRIIFAEELHRLGSGVVFADLATLWIALPPVVDYGSDELIEEVVKPILRGEKKIAFAVTEPTGGSDVAAIQTQAERNGEQFVVTGSKSLISGLLRADYVLTAVRTGGSGLGGISLLLIERDSEGIQSRPVTGLSWYNANIGTIEFSGVKVPANHLIGPENGGFKALTRQFNIERFSGVAATLAMSRVCLADAIAFARERRTFGQRLIDHQVIRHKLVEMIRRVQAAYAYLDQCAWRFENEQAGIAELGMLKIHATTTLERCARDSLHILGGTAYTGGARMERIFRESRIFSIGGGTEEILRDLAGRQLGF